MARDAFKECQSASGEVPLLDTTPPLTPLHIVDMASWTQTEWGPGRRVWERNMGAVEGSYYWDAVFHGATDTIMHVHLHATHSDATRIYSRANVHRAWSSVRRRYPVLAAEIQEDGYNARFVVREENVLSLREDDVLFATVSSFQAADHFITEIVDGSPPLSSKRLARLYILTRTDQPDDFHVVLVLTHCITDGYSTCTVLRAFFQTLASSYDPAPLPISLRLQMCLSMESRIRYEGLSLARQRWRRAIGFALHAVRHSRFKGGHTLPGNLTTATKLTPAKSRVKLLTFPRAMSDVILSNCHRYGIPLTCASYALSQVVLSRVLCRRYLKGEISDEEWEYRTREPMFFNGPVNLRPYLDQDWFQSGGSSEVGCNVSFTQHMLPFMPLGALRRKDDDLRLSLVDGAPDFPQLMSMERFLHRCNVVKAQVKRLFNHPHFVDICTAVFQFRLPIRYATADAWRSKQTLENTAPGSRSHGTPIPVPSLGPIGTQDGSGLGNMDEMLPLDYPLPASHPLSPVSQAADPHRAGYSVQPIPDDAVSDCATPRLHVAYWRTHMRLRPATLYLGSWSVRGQLQFFMFYDEHVFDADVVEEWMGELKGAMEYYLGEPRGKRENDAVPSARL